MLLRIFLILIVLGIIYSMGEYLWNHKVILSIGVIGVLIFFAKGKTSAFDFLLFAAVIYIGVQGILYLYKNYNENQLKKYLNEKCTYCGYMDNEKWRELLPKFSGLQYQTGFEIITSNFANQEERIAFSENAMRKQYPVCERVFEANEGGVLLDVLVSILIQQNSGYLQHTHSSTDDALMKKMIEQLCRDNSEVGSVDTKEGKLITHSKYMNQETYTLDEL